MHGSATLDRLPWWWLVGKSLDECSKLLLVSLWQGGQSKIVRHEDIHDLAEVIDGVDIDGTEVIISRMPDGRERIRDQVQHFYPASEERQMVVFDVNVFHVWCLVVKGYYIVYENLALPRSMSRSACVHALANRFYQPGSICSLSCSDREEGFCWIDPTQFFVVVWK